MRIISLALCICTTIFLITNCNHKKKHYLPLLALAASNTNQSQASSSNSGGSGSASGSSNGTGPAKTTATKVWGQSDFTSNSSGTSSTALHNPGDLFLDSSGGLYVSDAGNNRVIYFPSGKTTATKVWGQSNFTSNSHGTSSTAFDTPAGIASDDSGGLYVSEEGNSRVVYFPSGQTTATKVWGESNFTSSVGGTSSTTLKDATDVVLGSSGGLYVSDYDNNRVVYFPSGQTTATKVWGQSDLSSGASGTSSSSLHFPNRISRDGSGGMYVSDTANSRVLYFPSGKTAATRVWGQSDFTSNSLGTSSTNFKAPVGVALDKSGGIYVADSGNNRVLYFPSGSTTASTVYGQTDFSSGSSGTSSTSLNRPFALAVGSSGGLYVVDNGNNRVLYFPPGN